MKSYFKTAIIRSLLVAVLATLAIDMVSAQAPYTSSSQRLIVEESDRYAVLAFDETGGTRTLSISTNLGTPYVTTLPYWLTLVKASSTGMTFCCEPNSTSDKREADFRICAGDLSVKVHVRQPTSGRLVFKNCEFINTDQNADKISGPSSSMNAQEIRYLNPVLYYEGATKPVQKIIYVKIYDGRGHLLHTPNSPEGYTYKDKVTFNPGKNRSKVLIGLGLPDESIYTPGTVRVEIYCDDEMISSGSVNLY